MKNVLVILCILILNLTLIAGCNSGETEAEAEPPEDAAQGSGQGTPVSFTTPPDYSDYVYVTEYVTLPGGIGDISNLVHFGGKVFFTATITEAASEDNGHMTSSIDKIYSISPDGTGFTELDGYAPKAAKPDDAGGSNMIRRMTVDEEGDIWIAESWSFYRYEGLPADFNFGVNVPSKNIDTFENGIVVRKLDKETGAELLSVDLSGIADDEGYLNVAAIAICNDTDHGELIYLSSMDYTNATSAIHMLDTNGNILFEHEYENRALNNIELLRLGDGSVGFTNATYETFGSESKSRDLQLIDSAGMELGLPIMFPDFDWSGFMHGNKTRQIIHGNDEYDAFIRSEEGLYGFSRYYEQMVKLLAWNDSGVISNIIEDALMLPDGRVLCLSAMPTQSGQKSAEFLILTKTPRSEVPEKTVLTLAIGFGTVEIEYAVAEFNRKNSYYSIEINDYYGGNYENRRADINRFYMDIMAGNIPDIICGDLSNFSDDTMGRLFTDLYPYIDADPLFSRDDFVPMLSKVGEIDGKLYQAFPGFSISTIIGVESDASNPSRDVGSDMGWNMEEFTAFIDANPGADYPLGPYMTGTYFLGDIVYANRDDYIDWETGTVSFDTPEFVQLLELAKNRLPKDLADGETPPFPNVASQQQAAQEGRILLTSRAVGNMLELQEDKLYMGGSITYKGYPCKGRNGHNVDVFSAVAIAKDSPHKDIAWEFVRVLLDGNWQINNLLLVNFPSFNVIPTNKAAFNHVFETGWKNVRAKDTYAKNLDIDMLINQEDVDKVKALIESVPYRSRYTYIDTYEVLYNGIIREEASDYFNGMISAAEAAKRIQSRAGIYVSERSP